MYYFISGIIGGRPKNTPFHQPISALEKAIIHENKNKSDCCERQTNRLVRTT